MVFLWFFEGFLLALEKNSHNFLFLFFIYFLLFFQFFSNFSIGPVPVGPVPVGLGPPGYPGVPWGRGGGHMDMLDRNAVIC